jgi:hypothetical protein
MSGRAKHSIVASTYTALAPVTLPFVLVKERHRAEQLKRARTELYGPPVDVDDVWVWDVRHLHGAGA